MTEENQNLDTHDCVKGYVLNRVGGNNLPKFKPQSDLMSLENGEFMFDRQDHVKQRINYITLIQRIIVGEIDCLKQFSDCVLYHIPHKYSKEMSQKNEMVSQRNL